MTKLGQADSMPHYTSYDGTELAYRVLEARDGSAGPPLICLAGGPGAAPRIWATSAD
ncbi:hypothetical protein SANTM175S_00475 [Streptomyces antimycoticus]